MKLKNKYKNILFDLIENSKFDIKEFDYVNEDDHITILYISNKIKLSFRFECTTDKEFLGS